LASCRSVPSAGFLTGAIDKKTTFALGDFRNAVSRFSPEARKTNQTFVDLLRQVAERKEATPAQIALAWLLAQRQWIAPIPGTTKLHRLEENVRAADFELTAEELSEINAAASQLTVEGERLPEASLRLTGR
jgi:aryl-alcohol dehydrogenase-like predicted oxidoreductase